MCRVHVGVGNIQQESFSKSEILGFEFCIIIATVVGIDSSTVSFYECYIPNSNC